MADKEYIERGALIEMLNNKAKTDHEMGLYNHGALTESFIRFVERQPAADVVEVVRCKDCRLRDTEGCPAMFWDCGELMGETNDSDFCSYGERKETDNG